LGKCCKLARVGIEPWRKTHNLANDDECRTIELHRFHETGQFIKTSADLTLLVTCAIFDKNGGKRRR
jgi:hypothetical protein